MNGKLQFLGSSTQKFNFLSFACRLKNETDKLYNLKKNYCVFAGFQEHGSFFEILSFVCVRDHVWLADSVFWSYLEKVIPGR